MLFRSFLIRHPEAVLKFIEAGCLVQVTANAFTGFWGPKSRKAAEWLLHREAIHVVATDAHDLNVRRPVLSEARDRIAALVGVEIADALVTHNPAAIVAGQHVSFYQRTVDE